MRVSLNDLPKLTGAHRDWAYNCLDCTGTREIFDTLKPLLTPITSKTYAFEKACQAPAFEMMLEGVLVDTEIRSKRIAKLNKELAQLEAQLNALPLIKDVWREYETVTGLCDANEGKHHKWPKGVPDAERKCEHCGTARLTIKPFNPASSQQKMKLFYQYLECKPILNKFKKVTADDEAMDRIGRAYPKLKEITDAIQHYQGIHKQIGFLNGKLSADGRYPSSFNVGTAWTGRWSSSKNPFGLGGNLQNVAEQNRDIFVADPGWLLFYADLEQAESNSVAHLADDENYIDAHLSGDVHTFVTRLIWPDMAWTGDLAQDKAIAKTNPEWDKAPGHDLRFQAKRIQHGSNYGLTPPGIAIIGHIPQSAARFMQQRYFENFPGIKNWHRGIFRTIEAYQPILTPIGRRFRLYGNPLEGHTQKQALACGPQSMVADILNLSLWHIWHNYSGRIRLLAQVHDAILGMVRVDDTEALKLIKKTMTIPVRVGERVMRLGVEIAVGRNWGKKSPSNPSGIEVWKG